MRAWTFTFCGVYPVGAGGVVFAETEIGARFLATEAARARIGQDPQPVDLVEIPIATGATVILDGEY